MQEWVCLQKGILSLYMYMYMWQCHYLNICWPLHIPAMCIFLLVTFILSQGLLCLLQTLHLFVRFIFSVILMQDYAIRMVNFRISYWQYVCWLTFSPSFIHRYKNITMPSPYFLHLLKKYSEMSFIQITVDIVLKSLLKKLCTQKGILMQSS